MDKHLRDIAAILTVQADRLDFDYLQKWATHVGAVALWQALLDEYHARL